MVKVEVEGLKQMVRSLAEGSMLLPVAQSRVLQELDYLVTTMNIGLLQPEDQEKIVRRCYHLIKE